VRRPGAAPFWSGRSGSAGGSSGAAPGRGSARQAEPVGEPGENGSGPLGGPAEAEPPGPFWLRPRRRDK